VFVGLFLILFVEPPVKWFAVAEPVTPDRRPAMLAIGLGIAFVLMLLIPPGRAFFQLIVPEPRDALIVILAVVAWVFLVRAVWTYRVVERFLGRA
jgi:cation-transporting ATPase E